MSNFQRKAKVEWATKAQVHRLADELLELWDGQPTDVVVAKANKVLADASTGTLLQDGKNIYVVELIKAFESAGLSIPKPDAKQVSKSTLSAYA